MSPSELLLEPLSSELDYKRAEKREKLIRLANSVLFDFKYKKHFEDLMQALNFNYDKVIDGFLEYNLDSIFELPGNEIYSSIGNRFTLYIHNLLQGSWHIERQQTICQFMEGLHLHYIADIGFGVPSLYIKNILNNNIPIKIKLCDLYPSAFLFSSALLRLWDKDWDRKISYIQTDMDQQDYVGFFDLYIFQDSIEHTINPTAYLKKYVNESPPHSFFLLSLPIGPIIPGHYMAWNSNEEAELWLKFCGLKIVSQKDVYPNLDVDLFANDLGSEFHNYMVLCSKN